MKLIGLIGLIIVILGIGLFLAGISDGPAKFAVQHLQMFLLGLVFIAVGYAIVYYVIKFEENKGE